MKIITKILLYYYFINYYKTIKIKITKEKDNNYFAEIVGELGVHAIGETPEKAIEYLMDIYKQINELKY